MIPPKTATSMPETNQTSLFCSEDPDVVIVVGGKEYREYRQTLRCWSGYFDAAFRSGMKESKTSRFEFPDKDPKEWELVVSLVTPLSSEKVTKDNVQDVLPWFHELDCAPGLKECDKVLDALVCSVCVKSEDTLDDLVEVLAASLQCNLSAAEANCTAKINRLLSDNPGLFEVDHLQQVVSLMKSHQAFKNKIWETFHKCNILPLSMQSVDNVESLLDQDFFPHFLHCEIQRNIQRRSLEQTNASLRGTLGNVDRQLKESKSKVATMHRQLDESKVKVATMDRQLNESKSKVATMDRQLNESKSKVATMQHQLNESKSMVEYMVSLVQEMGEMGRSLQRK